MPKLWCHRFPKEISRISDLPKGFRPPPIATLAEFSARISEWFPSADAGAKVNADQFDCGGIMILGNDYTISILVFVEDDFVTGFCMDVRGEDSVISAVRRIIDGFAVRTCDRATGQFWNIEEGLGEALRQWREERDKQISESSATRGRE